MPLGLRIWIFDYNNNMEEVTESGGPWNLQALFNKGSTAYKKARIATSGDSKALQPIVKYTPFYHYCFKRHLQITQEVEEILKMSSESLCQHQSETSKERIPRTSHLLSGKAVQLAFLPLKQKYESSLRLVLDFFSCNSSGRNFNAIYKVNQRSQNIVQIFYQRMIVLLNEWMNEWV